MKPSHFIYLSVALCLMTTVATPAMSLAGLMHYTGQVFDLVEGVDFVNGVDRINGEFSFVFVGASQAQSVTLSSTLNGIELIIFNVPDITAPPPGITVITNSFSTWANGIPTQWDFTIAGNIFRNAEEEQISIHHSLGYLAAVDLGGIGGSTAINFVRGSFTAVPEPSSVALLGLTMAGVAYRRRSLRFR